MLVVLLVAGCGFHPLYAAKGASEAIDGAGDGADARPATREQMAATLVEPIADRPGQLLRNELVFLFSTSGEPVTPRYSFSVNLTESVTTFAVRVTGLATRANLQLTANYALTELATGEVLARGRADAIGSFDLLENEYATLIAAKYTREQAAKRLARILHMRLAAFYGTRPHTVSDVRG